MLINTLKNRILTLTLTLTLTALNAKEASINSTPANSVPTVPWYYRTTGTRLLIVH